MSPQGQGAQPGEEPASGQAEQMSKAVTSYFGSLPFIKYLRDDVTGTAFIDILE